ncbi:hypothetical protein ACROYT_G030542 [Oculina patagonica]
MTYSKDFISRWRKKTTACERGISSGRWQIQPDSSVFVRWRKEDHSLQQGIWFGVPVFYGLNPKLCFLLARMTINKTVRPLLDLSFNTTTYTE